MTTKQKESNMTPCERLGYKVGDRFEVLEQRAFEVGDTVELLEDDGSKLPIFKGVNCRSRSGCDHACAWLPKLKPISKEKFTLRPGMYVSTDGMTEEQYRGVVRAFEAAGCPRWNGREGYGRQKFLQWDDSDDTLTGSFDSPGGQQITIGQALLALEDDMPEGWNKWDEHEGAPVSFEEEWKPVNGDMVIDGDGDRSRFIGMDGDWAVVLHDGDYHRVVYADLKPIPANQSAILRWRRW